jgi:hypothetical protein
VGHTWDRWVAWLRRCAGCFEPDLGTCQLARELVDALVRLAGASPSLVLNELRRVKVDMNRPLPSAVDQGGEGRSPLAEAAWSEYHTAIKSLLDSHCATSGYCMLIDLHGQSHRPCSELGYLVTQQDLRQADAVLDAMVPPPVNSVQRLADVSAAQLSLSELIRGPSSLGACLERQGYAALPSPSHPHPGYSPSL